jgi:hypothetical protein
MVYWTNPLEGSKPAGPGCHVGRIHILKNTGKVIKSPRVPMIETSNELVVYSAQGVYAGVIWDILGGQDWELGGDVINDAERRAHHYYQLCRL